MLLFYGLLVLSVIEGGKSTYKEKYQLQFEKWIFHNDQSFRDDDRTILQRLLQPSSNVA